MSNLYATKVSTEHPIEMWPMDDGTSYLSLIKEFQRDMSVNWIGDEAVMVSAGYKGDSPFPDSKVSAISMFTQTGNTIADEYISVTLGSTQSPLFSASDIVDGVPVAAFAYIWIDASDNVESIDIGSSDVSGSFTKTSIPIDASNSWVRVESSNLNVDDGAVTIRFNLNEGRLRSSVTFDVNGIAVGQRLEAYPDTLGVNSSKIGPYIKSRGIPQSQYNRGLLKNDMTNVDFDTVTLAVGLGTFTETSSSPQILTLETSKRHYANYAESKRTIIEPLVSYATPYYGPDHNLNHSSKIDPTDKDAWFKSYRDALILLVREFPAAWGIYVGTRLTKLEEAVDTHRWKSLIEDVRAEFDGKILYCTSWWEDTDPADATTKRDLALWEYVDIMAVASYFPLTDIDKPTQLELESALNPETGQNVYEEIMALNTKWGKPILLTITCPAVDDGSHEPWNINVSAVANENIQSRLIGAYQNVFGDTNGYMGFSVPYAGSVVAGEAAFALSASAETTLSEMATSPIDNNCIELVPSGDSGYYIAEENRLLAHNTGIPLVYGSKTYTRLTGSIHGAPSFVFDGHGAFNDSGRGQAFTIEFWMRMSGTTHTDRKIFGPVDHRDGLYIKNGTLTLLVGGNQASANIGILSNPMIVHIRLHQNRVDLMVNGDSLASVDVDMSIPNWSSASDTMLGFYSYEEIDAIDIDCVSMFAYLVPEVVAMRRFAWGQAIDQTDLTNLKLGGRTAQADFSTSSTAHNVSYPDNYSWDAGIYENLEVEGDRIRIPDRPLPEIILSESPQKITFESLLPFGPEEWNPYPNTFFYPSHGVEQGDIVILSNLLGGTFVEAVEGVEYYAVDVTPTIFGISISPFGEPLVLNDPGGTVTADVTYISEKTYSKENLFEDTRIENRRVVEPRDRFFSFVPNDNWIGEKGYFYFETISDYIDFPRLFAVTWSSDIEGTESILTIRSKQDHDRYLRVYRDGNKVVTEFGHVKEELVDDVIEIVKTYTVINEEDVVKDHKYTSVINFNSSSLDPDLTPVPKISTIPKAMQFLMNSLDDLEIIVGSGEADLFTGCLHRMSFMNESAKKNVDHLLGGYAVQTLDYDGMPNEDKDAVYNGTYCVFPQLKHGMFYPEIHQVAYWEDYIPMSVLAGVVNDLNGDPTSLVDHIQFNMGVPRPSSTSLRLIYKYFNDLYDVEGETYGQFDIKYAAPMTYEELAPQTVDSPLYEYDTRDLEVRAFISFQKEDSYLKSMDQLANTVSPTELNTVYFDADGIQLGDKIEVIDGTTIVTPKKVRLENTTVSVHLEIVSQESHTRPVSVKSLEIASHAHNKDSATDISSQSGKPVYPILENGFYLDWSAINPYRLDKRGLPALYLGRESGFVPTGIDHSEFGIDRGLAILIDEAKGRETYGLSALQFWMRVDEEFDPTHTHKIYEFKNENIQISLMMTGIEGDPTRASIVAMKDGLPYTDMAFFQNGSLISVPIVSRFEWVSLSMVFLETMDIQAVESVIKVYTGAAYSNISYFSETEVQKANYLKRSWGEIAGKTWGEWTTFLETDDGEATWKRLLITSDLDVELPDNMKEAYLAVTGAEKEVLYSLSPLTLSQGPIRTSSITSTVSSSQAPS
jgi:hypothetical protein